MATKRTDIVPPLTEELTDEERAAREQEERGTIPEQQAAPEAEPEKPKEPKPVETKTVPYDRFHELNEEHKAAKREAAELREKWARLEERQRLVQEAQQRLAQEQQRPKGPARPDETVDPIGAQLWDRDRRLEQLEQRNQQLEQQVGQVSQFTQQQQQVGQFQTWLTMDENAYRVQKPDYDMATQHLRQRMQEFAQGIGVPDQEINTVISQLAYWVADAARRTGKSPANEYYRLAQVWGYAGPQPAPNGNGNGQQQQTAPAKPSPTETLRQVQKGQALQGLNRGPAQSDDNVNWTTMTAQDWNNMSDDEFASRLADPKQRPYIERAFARLEGVG